MDSLSLDLRSEIQMFERKLLPIYGPNELIDYIKILGIDIKDLLQDAMDKSVYKKRIESSRETIIEIIADIIYEHEESLAIDKINISDKNQFYYILIKAFKDNNETSPNLTFNNYWASASVIVDKIKNINKMKIYDDKIIIKIEINDTMLIKVSKILYTKGTKIDFLSDIVNLYKLKYTKQIPSVNTQSYSFSTGWC